MYNFIENNQLYSKLFRFSQNHTTFNPLIRLTESSKSNVYIKADGWSVYQCLLWLATKSYVINYIGMVLDLQINYLIFMLQNSIYFFKMFNSQMLPVSCGDPLILGPFVFLLYVNDFVKDMEKLLILRYPK